MTEAIYQKQIIDLARARSGAGRLEGPQAVATVDNPICGDRITIELSLDGDTVSALAHKVRGCLLCEAAASMIGRHAAGMSPQALRDAAAVMDTMVRHGGSPPADWPEAGVFTPVREAKSRHRCVLLPFEALLAALDEVGRQSSTT